MVRGVTFVLYTDAKRVSSSLYIVRDVYGKCLIAAGMRSRQRAIDIDAAALIAGAKIQ